MGYEIPLQVITLEAAANLSANQYHWVKVDSNGRAALAVAADKPVGILQNKPTALGQAATVMTYGISKVVAGASLTAGNTVRADASSHAVAASAGEPAGGIAMESADSADIIAVLLAGAPAITGTAVASYAMLAIPISLALITGAMDVVTTFTPGFAGTIEKVQFIVTAVVTTADKLASLNLEIGTTNLTGGVVALTSANCATLGATVAGSAITANNSFGASDTVSVEAASVTAFQEGAGILVVTLKPTLV